MTRKVIRTGSVAILGLLFLAPISYSSTVSQPTLWKFYVGQPIEAVKQLMNGVYAESRFDPNDQTLIAALEAFNVSTSDARAELDTVRALVPDNLFLRRLACGDARISGISAAPSCARPLLDKDLKGVVVWIDDSDTVRAVRIQKGYSRFARPKTMIEDMVSQLGQPSSRADGSSHEATAGFGLPGVSLHDSPSFTFHFPASSERDVPPQKIKVQLYKDVVTGSWATYHWSLQNAPKWSDSEKFASIVTQVFNVQTTTAGPKPAMAQSKSNQETRTSPITSDGKVGTGPLLTSGRSVVIEGIAPLATDGWGQLGQEFGVSKEQCTEQPVRLVPPDWVDDPRLPAETRKEAKAFFDSNVGFYWCRWITNGNRRVSARISESGTVFSLRVQTTYRGSYEPYSALVSVLGKAREKYGPPDRQALPSEQYLKGHTCWKFRDYPDGPYSETDEFCIIASADSEGLALYVDRSFVLNTEREAHRTEYREWLDRELQAILDDAMGEKQVPDVEL